MAEFDKFCWELLLVIFRENLSIEISALCEVRKTCPTQAQNRVGSMGFSPFHVDQNYSFLQLLREYVQVSLTNYFGGRC